MENPPAKNECDREEQTAVAHEQWAIESQVRYVSNLELAPEPIEGAE